MKPTLYLALLSVWFLTGCYSMFVINAGIANKSASAYNAPLDPTTACAALTTPSITITSTNPIQGNVAQDWMTTCVKVLEEQQRVKEKKK